MSDLTISSLGKDVDDLMAMSEEELRALVTEKCDGMSDEDLTTLLETLSEEFAAVEDGIQSDTDDEEDELDVAEDADDTSEIERHTDEIEELHELEESLDALQESISAEVERQVYLTRESSDDVSVFVDGAFTADDVTDGETISITCTGTDAEGIFEEDETASNDADGDGIADSDINGDSRIDAADLYYEADTGTEYDFSAHQEVYFSLTSTQQITATAYDASRQARTFTAYDSATLKTFKVEIIGNVRIQFQGTNYITDSALNSASDEITRYCYDNADTESWYENLHVDDSTPTVDQQMSAIPGYQDIIDNLSTDLALMDTYIAQSVALSDASTDVALPSNAAEIITTWVGYLLDSTFTNSYNSDTDLTEAWDKVYAELATYSQDLQAVLLGSLTYVVAKSSMKNGLTVAANASATLFQTLFASQVIKIETIVGYAGDGLYNNDGNDDTDIGAFGKFIYTILEMDSGGAGGFGGTAMMTNGMAFSPDGVTYATTWPNTEEGYQTLCWREEFLTGIGQPVDSGTSTAKANMHALQEIEDEKGTTTVEISKYELSALKKQGYDNIDQTYLTYSDTVEADLYAIFDKLYNGGEPINVSDLRTYILDTIQNHTPQDERDELASILMWTLYKKQEGIFNTLLEDSGFKSNMHSWIFEGNAINPTFADWLKGKV